MGKYNGHKDSLYAYSAALLPGQSVKPLLSTVHYYYATTAWWYTDPMELLIDKKTVG